jgi:hypothetical protein
VCWSRPGRFERFHPLTHEHRLGIVEKQHPVKQGKRGLL